MVWQKLKLIIFPQSNAFLTTTLACTYENVHRKCVFALEVALSEVSDRNYSNRLTLYSKI